MSAPKVQLRLQPVPRAVMRVAIAGEYLRNLGMREDRQIANIQQAVAEGLVAKLSVVGRSSDGRVRDVFDLELDRLEREDSVLLDLAEGCSYLEALDPALAGSVAWAVGQMRRRGLIPDFYIYWSAQARANPQHLQAACRRLNLIVEAPDAPPAHDPFPPREAPASDWPQTLWPEPPAERESDQPVRSAQRPPSLPPGYEYRQVLSVTPGRDPGIRFKHQTVRRGA